MSKIKLELQNSTESAALDIVSRDTGKDVGDFAGVYGLVNWLQDNEYSEHAELLKDVFNISDNWS